MVSANINVMAFAKATGKLGVMIPYINHMNVPKVNTAYMDKDIPEVSLVRMVFIACGKKEMVVLKAATKPMISI
jgi:hypothetical protein